MGIIDKAKDAAGVVTGKAKEAVDKVQEQSLGDDFFADFIIKHTGKQEHINEILISKGSNYRIGNVEIEVGVPPKVVFVVERRSEG